MGIKKIYETKEAMVSDDVINGSDESINKAIPEFRAGDVIYTAGQSIVKQKSLDDKWVAMPVGGGAGADGKDGFSPTVATEPAEGGTKITITDAQGEHEFTVLNGKDGAKGDKGDPGTNGSDGAPGKDGAVGKDGTPGENGKDGKSVSGLTLVVDADGKIQSGTVQLDDGSSVAITVTTQE